MKNYINKTLRLFNDEITATTDLSGLTSLGRRQHLRFHGCLTTILSNPHRSFRTETLNISEGGALLTSSVPKDFQEGPFDVLLILETETGARQFLNLRGVTMNEAQAPANRVQFSAAPEDLGQRLEHFFGSKRPQA